MILCFKLQIKEDVNFLFFKKSGKFLKNFTALPMSVCFSIDTIFAFQIIILLFALK